MAQEGLLAIISRKAKEEEARLAAEGKTPPAGPSPPPAKPAPKPAVKPSAPAVPYVPIKEKTPEEKARLHEEMVAEIRVRDAGRKKP